MIRMKSYEHWNVKAMIKFIDRIKQNSLMARKFFDGHDGNEIIYEDLEIMKDSIHESKNTSYSYDGDYTNSSKVIDNHD